MAMNAYTGIMGSGKSFEVVQNVILPALLAGRRVVTNVAGLKIAEINAYLIEKFNADPSSIGTIVPVGNDLVPSPAFFPKESKEGIATSASVVLGGDLVVIDECWRWWATGCKISMEHMTFFRMHRHFVNDATLATCDIVLVVQDIGDLDRKVKVVVENTYRMTKLKALGTSKRYRVDVYAGYKLTAGAVKIREMQRRYDPEIFALYSSYSQGAAGGKEGVIDKRATIWGGPLFKVILPLLFVLSCVAFWSIWSFFHSKTANSVAVAAVGVGVPSVPHSGSSLPGRTAAVTGESDWRVQGHFSSDGRHYVVLVRGDAVRLLLNPPGFFYDGVRAYGSLDGKVLSNYTGTDPFRESKGAFGDKR